MALLKTTEMAKKLGLAEEEVAGYKTAFTAFDKNVDGTIDTNELKNLLDTIKLPDIISKKDVIESLPYLDFSASGKIDFPEFLYLMSCVTATKPNDIPVVRELNTIAGKVDKDGNGYISKEELTVALAKFVPADKMDEEFKAFDEDGDGQVSIKEFVKRYCKYYYRSMEQK